MMDPFIKLNAAIDQLALDVALFNRTVANIRADIEDCKRLAAKITSQRHVAPVVPFPPRPGPRPVRQNGSAA